MRSLDGLDKNRHLIGVIAAEPSTKVGSIQSVKGKIRVYKWLLRSLTVKKWDENWTGGRKSRSKAFCSF